MAISSFREVIQERKASRATLGTKYFTRNLKDATCIPSDLDIDDIETSSMNALPMRKTKSGLLPEVDTPEPKGEDHDFDSMNSLFNILKEVHNKKKQMETRVNKSKKEGLENDDLDEGKDEDDEDYYDDQVEEDEEDELEERKQANEEDEDNSAEPSSSASSGSVESSTHSAVENHNSDELIEVNRMVEDIEEEEAANVEAAIVALTDPIVPVEEATEEVPEIDSIDEAEETEGAEAQAEAEEKTDVVSISAVKEQPPTYIMSESGMKRCTLNNHE